MNNWCLKSKISLKLTLYSNNKTGELTENLIENISFLTFSMSMYTVCISMSEEFPASVNFSTYFCFFLSLLTKNCVSFIQTQVT